VAWAEARGLTRRDRREDEYVLLPGAATVGIKLREGRIEVKALTEPPIPWGAGGLEGHLERWAKWSQPVSVITGWGEGPGVHKIRVEKERWARWADGCLMEVTRLRVRDQEWWTVAVEQSGAGAQPGDLTSPLGELGGIPGADAVMIAESSKSYPEWLEQFFVP